MIQGTHMPISKKTKTAAKAKKKAPAKAKKKAAPKTRKDQNQQSRLWLMYPPKFITRPVIHELGNKFKVVPNVRQASVTEEIGIVCLELTGPREQVKSAIKWMEKLGISVEPVEINVIES